MLEAAASDATVPILLFSMALLYHALRTFECLNVVNEAQELIVECRAPFR